MEALLEARRQLEEQRRRLEAEGREGELRLRELQQRQEQALARLARAGTRRDARVEEAAAARARVAARQETATRVEEELWGSWVELRPLDSIHLTEGMALAIRQEVARRHYRRS